MSVIFVMGPSCAGKSTFIANRYPNLRKIDLYDYQSYLFERKFYTIDDILKSYEDCKRDVVEAVKNNEDIVLEHTMLKAIRRKEYIDAIREVSDTKIGIVVIYPSDEKILEHAEKRGIKMSQKELDDYRELYEEPKVTEGYSKISIFRQEIE